MAHVEQRDAVMLLVAAQPDYAVLGSVRDAKAKLLGIEGGSGFEIDALQRDVAEPERADFARLQRLIEARHAFKQLDPVAVGVQITEGRAVPWLVVRPLQRLDAALRQRVAGGLKRFAVHDLESQVMQRPLRARIDCQAMMFFVAAHKNRAVAAL